MKEYNNTISFFNYIFIFLVINYTIFVNFITGVDSTGYGLSALSIIVFVLNYKDVNRIQQKKPVLFWLLWCLFAFLNYYFHSHPNPISIVVLYRRIFVPLITMTVVIKEYQKDSNKLLWLCFITHVIYLAFGVFFDRGLIFGVVNSENELGNSFALVSCFAMFYIALLNRSKKINFLISVLLITIIMIVIAMTGTRKAFGAGFIIVGFWIFSFLKQQKSWSWILVGAFVLVGIKGYQVLLDNTYVGERMQFLEAQQEDALPQGAPDFLSVFGDRASHYYYGWQSFKKHPLFGVGTGQSRIGNGSYIHSEYMAQLSDEGLIGAFLFVMLIWWVGKSIIKRWSNDRIICKCMLGGFAAILFLYFTTWGWEFPHYFMCLGILIGYCKSGFLSKYV